LKTAHAGVAMANERTRAKKQIFRQALKSMQRNTFELKTF